MSKRRQVGDKVWLRSFSGFCVESNKYQVEIMDQGASPCMWDDCKDPKCQEWATVWTLPDHKGERFGLCHVSECEMFDEPQTREEKKED